MQRFKEGEAGIALNANVFFNPKMKQLRDVSSLLLQATGANGMRGIDCTAATGVRGIRYIKEAGLKDVVFLDVKKEAVDLIARNLKANRINGTVINQPFQHFANTCKDRFDVIDIDPFGTPAGFVYDAMRISRDGTILMATATDTAVLCGARKQACMKNYWAEPMHNELCHEAGLRILLNYIARNAAEFDFGIEPMLSVADMHYMRAVVRLRNGASVASESLRNSGIAQSCAKCHNFDYAYGNLSHFGEECSFCRSKMVLSGPMWMGKLNDKELVKRMIVMGDGRLERHSLKLLSAIYNEVETPFFYSIPKITRYLGVPSVPLSNVIDNLEKNFKTSRTCFDDSSIKTMAGITDVIQAIKKA